MIRLRRGAPELLVGVLFLLLLASYVAYTRRVVQDLRREAERTSRNYARVYRALSDTTTGAETQALVELSRSITEQRVPLVVTDPSGRPVYFANLHELPDDVRIDDPRVAAVVPRLDRENPPIVEPGIQTVHFGNPPLVRWLRIIPAIQATVALLLVALGAWIVRERHDAVRERLWAGMARESAHQLGTPLSSLAGWLELLEERRGDPMLERAVSQMRADLERLDRVAHRFERIGRDPRREPVELSALVDRVVDYFRPRLPTLANTVTLDAAHETDGPLEVRGDAVLLEWALEVLVKNALDALAGRGGRVQLTTTRGADGARVRVSDDGPGVPRELRERIFEPGFSTKSTGWGIGLALAKRIAEESHDGRLELLPSDQGAAFEIILR
jgi:signal transduction histidine kinase